jgi:hypothetical protein
MNRSLSVLLLAVLCLLAVSSVSQADVAPPQQPPGFNPEPGSEITQVRMLAESVAIDVLAVEPARAHASAVFTMHNLGSETENLAVRFPIAANDGRFNLIEIKNLKIKVDGQAVTYERIQGPEPNFGFEDESAPWAVFDVNFPPGEDVEISVTYDLDGTGYEEETRTSFYYILSTGAGWNGTIGSGEIILRLPYDASPQNVILDEYQDMPQFSGREVRWFFTELEPTPSDNLSFEIVKPAVWEQVIRSLEDIARNPQDGEAYGYLGKAYKQAYFAAPKRFPRTDPGAAGLFELSREAYKKAVTLKPDDGLWHAGYAELLLDNRFWQDFQDQSYTDDLHLGLQELDLAWQLAPDEEKVLELVDRYSYSYPDYIVRKPDGSPDFLSLTSTPQFTAEINVPADTATPTDTPVPTSRPATITPTSETQPTTSPVSPLCGGAALILLPVGLMIWKSGFLRM